LRLGGHGVEVMDEAERSKGKKRMTFGKGVLWAILGAVVAIPFLVAGTIKQVYHELWLEEGNPYAIEEQHQKFQLIGNFFYYSSEFGLGSNPLGSDFLRTIQSTAYTSIKKSVPENDVIWIKYWEEYQLIPYILKYKSPYVDKVFFKEALEVYNILMKHESKAKLYNSVVKYDTISRLLRFFAVRVKTLSMSKESKHMLMQNIAKEGLIKLRELDLSPFFSTRIQLNAQIRMAPIDIVIAVLKIGIVFDSGCHQKFFLNDVLVEAKKLDSAYSSYAHSESYLDELKQYTNEATMIIESNKNDRCDSHL
jgi:hypothetical protein